MLILIVPPKPWAGRVDRAVVSLLARDIGELEGLVITFDSGMDNQAEDKDDDEPGDEAIGMNAEK